MPEPDLFADDPVSDRLTKAGWRPVGDGRWFHKRHGTRLEPDALRLAGRDEEAEAGEGGAP